MGQRPLTWPINPPKKWNLHFFARTELSDETHSKKGLIYSLKIREMNTQYCIICIILYSVAIAHTCVRINNDVIMGVSYY